MIKIIQGEAGFGKRYLMCESLKIGVKGLIPQTKAKVENAAYDQTCSIPMSASLGRLIFRTEDEADAERLAIQIISRDRALFYSKAEIDAMEEVALSDETIVFTKTIQTLPNGVGYFIPVGEYPVKKISVVE